MASTIEQYNAEITKLTTENQALITQRDSLISAANDWDLDASNDSCKHLHPIQTQKIAACKKDTEEKRQRATNYRQQAQGLQTTIDNNLKTIAGLQANVSALASERTLLAEQGKSLSVSEIEANATAQAKAMQSNADAQARLIQAEQQAKTEAETKASRNKLILGIGGALALILIIVLAIVIKRKLAKKKAK